MSKKPLVMFGAVLLLLGVAGGAYYATRGGDGRNLVAASAATLPPDKVNADDMVMGRADAPVTMIEYYAQACSVCARFSQEVFPLLKAKYIDTGKVRYVMRLFPLFPVDGPSYKLTRCVSRDKYFQATDLMFRSQPEWDSAEYQGVDAKAGLLKMAAALGMDENKAMACMMNTDNDAAINKVAQDGADRYQIGGTPTLVINFKKVEMPQKSWSEVQAALDAALAAKGIK